MTIHVHFKSADLKNNHAYELLSCETEILEKTYPNWHIVQIKFSS